MGIGPLRTPLGGGGTQSTPSPRPPPQLHLGVLTFAFPIGPDSPNCNFLVNALIFLIDSPKIILLNVHATKKISSLHLKLQILKKIKRYSILLDGLVDNILDPQRQLEGFIIVSLSTHPFICNKLPSKSSHQFFSKLSTIIPTLSSIKVTDPAHFI